MQPRPMAWPACTRACRATSARARPSLGPRGRRFIGTAMATKHGRPRRTPRCPIRSASYTGNHQAVGATRRPFCLSGNRSDTNGQLPTQTRRDTSPKRRRDRGVRAMFAIQPVEADTRPIREPRLAGPRAAATTARGSMTELFFSEQLDDIAAAKAFCLECPVKDDVPRRRAACGASRGACGAASCS